MPVAESLQTEVQMNPPPAASVVLTAARDYLERAGMSQGDLAHEVGYSGTSIKKFFRGSYTGVAANDTYVRHALWRYMDEHPVTGDDDELPKKLLPTGDTKLLLARMVEAQDRGLIVVVEGPPGTCKTTALKWFWADHNRKGTGDREQGTEKWVHRVFYLRAWSGITGAAMLQALCRLAGARSRGTRYTLLRNLVRRLREARPALLLIDECQYLLGSQAEAFEQLRDVLDLARCGCVLAGHFNFVRNLTNGMGRILEQWLSRIDLHEHLRGLTAAEIPEIAREYLDEELPADLRKDLVAFATARDRNAAYRSQLLREGAERLPFRYLSIRRVRKFFERVEDLRAIPENAGKPLAALARAALKMLMAPEGKAL